MGETFRVWIENAETFFLEVILERRGGFWAGIVRGILYLFSKVFELIIKLRGFLYNVRILRDSTLGVQVIAIGNLTVGGTGSSARSQPTTTSTATNYCSASTLNQS